MSANNEASVVKKQEPVAKTYARALFELSMSRDSLESVLADFQAIVELSHESRILETLRAYTFSVQERQNLAKELANKMKLSDLFSRFLQLLVAKGRIQLLFSIYDSFLALVDQKNGTVRGTVIVAQDLQQAQEQELSQAISKKINKKVLLEQVRDPEILGGLIVNVQGLTFDGSLRAAIRNLKENLERQSL